jgi:hypothetical protein
MVKKANVILPVIISLVILSGCSETIKEFYDDQSKDITYGLRETAFKAKNVMFTSMGFTEIDQRAIDRLK